MTKTTGEYSFTHDGHTCPWWLCFTFDNPLRGLLQNPFRILNGYVNQGDIVLDIGPGMGYFTFPISEMTGGSGKVVALDIQEGILIAEPKIHVNRKRFDESIKHLTDADFIIAEEPRISLSHAVVMRKK